MTSDIQLNLIFMHNIFETINFINDYFWEHIGLFLICFAGLLLTFYSNFFQFRALYHVKLSIKNLLNASSDKDQLGLHPLRLYFASVGGMVGLGNIVGASMAIVIGGPGSILWILIASLCGTLLKYSEIYLGVKYRIKNESNGYDGGPMYYLQQGFKSNFLPYLVAFLICLYGVEIFQFLVIVDRLEHSFHFNRSIIISVLLIIIIYTATGGIKRLSNAYSFIMPIFLFTYLSFAFYIIFDHANLLPSFFVLVIKSAFTGQAAIGAFIGSSVSTTAYMGISKAVYSGDIGIGYDAIVQSETRVINPKTQATIAIYGLLSDSLLCIITATMLGVSGIWYKTSNLEPSDVVAKVLSGYLSHADIFITLLIFVAGFSTVVAYLTVGMKCAKFISPKFGRYFYLTYAIMSFIFFSYLPQQNVMAIMSLLSGLLILVNIIGIIVLRKKIEF